MTTEIKLDYDKITSKDVGLIFEHRAWFLKSFGIERVRAFQTKRGYHVRVDVEEYLTPEEVLLVQMLMGSDIYREIFNFLRKRDGKLIENWNKLYTKKYLVLGTKIKKVISSERYLKGLTKDLIKSIEKAKDLRGFL